MTSLEIVQAGDPVLRAVAVPVVDEEIVSAEFHDFVEAMIATMRAAPGVGLAAPQVGVSKRVLVAEDRDSAIAALPASRIADMERVPFGPLVMINPEMRPASEERRVFFEGCLSVAGFAALVARYREIEVRWTDETGVHHGWTRFSGWPARILQHEIDHLDGVLYTDRMIARSFMTAEAMRARAAMPVADILREAGITERT
ncbi:peptide deformylase [Pseudoxanthobacter soli DSM 19599]|uniref:Peptide deformylase n=1 Tax=Pseudoxanthobacter soli DSM 19599 TaxID=1123029 RepID=A0A1M7ZQ50_9HYPH|nr:peptide deformylase [Pseudoxanthobacter soli]SHO67034.1 peptide deformylase [Pseudoxanthobacter soli DSM 19599]